MSATFLNLNTTLYIIIIMGWGYMPNGRICASEVDYLMTSYIRGHCIWNHLLVVPANGLHIFLKIKDNCPYYSNNTIVFFNRLGSRCFTVYLINIYFFPKIKNTEKPEHSTFGRICSDFLNNVLLMILINIKCQWDFTMGKIVVQLLGC